jgi:hypothetical protein
MAEVIGFNGPEAAWRVHEAAIRGWVRELGYGSEVADWVIVDLKQRQFQLQHVTTTSWDSIPAEARPHLAEISHGFKDAYCRIMIGWLIEVVKIECELWVAKFAAKG